MIQTFVHSKKLQEKHPERVDKWEKASLERMDDFKIQGSYKRYAQGKPKDEPGYIAKNFSVAVGIKRTGPTPQMVPFDVGLVGEKKKL